MLFQAKWITKCGIDLLKNGLGSITLVAPEVSEILDF
jgi:hypothetical protein